MVKGVTRQVVVVRSPDPTLFEQAIFIVRGDGTRGITEQEVLEQARRAAGGYVSSRADGGRCAGGLLQRVGLMLLGALPVALAWVLCAVL